MSSALKLPLRRAPDSHTLPTTPASRDGPAAFCAAYGAVDAAESGHAEPAPLEQRGVAHMEQRLATQLKLAGLFTAITGCFVVYSLIQERLMTLGFGPEQERFTHSLFIILVNRLVTCAVAAAALGLLGKSLQPAAPLTLFAIPSVANVVSSSSQYEALKYVSFPLQALAKCAKTVSV